MGALERTFQPVQFGPRVTLLTQSWLPAHPVGCQMGDPTARVFFPGVY